MATTVRAQQGDTIDLICYRHYGRTAGVVEAVYAANPNISDHGPVLPLGTPVLLPDAPPAEKDTTVKLWE